jgi:hypothetical protein
MASTSLPSPAATALPVVLLPLPPLLPPPPTPRCRCQRRVSAALPNALPLPPKSRFRLLRLTQNCHCCAARITSSPEIIFNYGCYFASTREFVRLTRGICGCRRGSLEKCNATFFLSKCTGTFWAVGNLEKCTH